MLLSKRVKDYVKKYPLYSVNKLAEELPEISRHSIQRILEKNNLSKIKDRLAFAGAKKLKILQRFGLDWRRKNIALLGVLILVVWWGISFALAESPDIQLEQPGLGFINKGGKLFVSGQVMPANSRVVVNGEKVSLNGDGTFTAVVEIPAGESILKVEAFNKRKKAQLQRVIKRVLTEEEQRAQEKKEMEEKKEVMDKTATLDQKVKDLLAAKNATTTQEKGFLRVLNSKLLEQAGFSNVAGEVLNQGEKGARWVMITVRFYDQGGQEVDKKYGFATDFGEVLEPGKIAKFETQATQKKLDRYSLELSWEEPMVAGAATESGEKAE